MKNIIEYLGIDTTNIDTPETKRLLQTAADIERKYEKCISSGNIGYALTGDIGVYITCNKVIEEIGGISVYE